MVILGIDPGIATVGYGVIEQKGNSLSVIDYGVIETPKNETIPVRLKMVYDGINYLAEKYKPDSVAVEELFYFKNAKTIIQVGQARGVIVLALIEKCGRIYEYTPLQIKQALTGYGRAEKAQIQFMVRTMLNLKCDPKPDDAADALAVAVTHAQTNTQLMHTEY